MKARFLVVASVFVFACNVPQSPPCFVQCGSGWCPASMDTCSSNTGCDTTTCNGENVSCFGNFCKAINQQDGQLCDFDEQCNSGCCSNRECSVCSTGRSSGSNGNTDSTTNTGDTTTDTTTDNTNTGDTTTGTGSNQGVRIAITRTFLSMSRRGAASLEVTNIDGDPVSLDVFAPANLGVRIGSSFLTDRLDTIIEFFDNQGLEGTFTAVIRANGARGQQDYQVRIQVGL